MQWYPGHMAQAARRLRQDLRLVDIVVEVVDARIARSGRNPMLDELAVRRTHLVALNRQDLAEPAITNAWRIFLSRRNCEAVAVEGRAPRSVGRLAAAILASPARGGDKKLVRAMIVGIPNSGKSSIVNALLRRAAAKTQRRAGVTRKPQWFRLTSNLELLDTPGLLPPKIGSAAAQWKLAICGAVPSERYDPQQVVTDFHGWLLARRLHARVPDLASFAEERGFIRRGGGIDYHNAAHSYIRAFNDGAFGRISLEAPDDAEAA